MGRGCVNDAGNEAASAQCFLAGSLLKRLWERWGIEGCSQDGGGAGACLVGVITPKVGKHVAEEHKVSVPTGEANEPRSNGE
jgi:hypothetical protein